VAAAIQILVKDLWRNRRGGIAISGSDPERPPPEVAPEPG
jgi:hypothetical protein